MATQAATYPASTASPLLAVFSLWFREVRRFYRQRARVVGVILSPLLFWLVLGAGFNRSLAPATSGAQNYLEYFFPGTIIMIVLFTSIFTMMSVIDDRREGFLLSVLVAPVPRSAIVLAKILGGTTLAAGQGLLFLLLTPLLGLRFGPEQFAVIVGTVFLVSFALTALGFAVAWRLDSTQAFHGIVNLFLLPMWMLSGALFPLAGATGWVRTLMKINPITYGVEAIRQSLFPAASKLGMPLERSLLILVLFSATMFMVALSLASRRSNGRNA